MDSECRELFFPYFLGLPYNVVITRLTRKAEYYDFDTPFIGRVSKKNHLDKLENLTTFVQ